MAEGQSVEVIPQLTDSYVLISAKNKSATLYTTCRNFFAHGLA